MSVEKECRGPHKLVVIDFTSRKSKKRALCDLVFLIGLSAS